MKQPWMNLALLGSLAICHGGLLACGGAVSVDNSGDGDASGGQSGDGDGDWQSMHVCDGNEPMDPIDTKAARVVGDVLEVDAGHGAGCATHTYGICYVEGWSKSLPPMVGLELLHDNGGEQCEAYDSPTLTFDLMPLQEAYKEQYQADSGEILLTIGAEMESYRFGESSSELRSWENLEEEIEKLNYCETIDDCRSISTHPCDAAFINEDVDSTSLEEDIAARNKADTGQDSIACPANCECGVLRCTEGACQTAPGNCIDTPDGSDERMICL